MKSYFARQDGGAEIADDIEHRVAELLWQRKEAGAETVCVEDVKEIITNIKLFYSQASISHISVATHYNVAQINSCNKNVSSILSAIRTYKQICETSNLQELLLKFSRDPVQGMEAFVSLVELAGKDVDTANKELADRLNNSIPEGEGNGENHYLAEAQSIQTCKELIAEVKNNVN